MYYFHNDQWIVCLDNQTYEFDYLDDAIAFLCQHGYAS